MPIAGGTAPLTVPATATMNIAEFFGAATAMQLRAPGAPLIFGAAPGLLDMKQTTFASPPRRRRWPRRSASRSVTSSASPAWRPSQSTDAKHPGIQAAYEKALKGFTVAATRPDLMTGIGMLHAANLRLAAADRHRRRDGAGMMLHILDGPEVSEETLLVEMMERMGFAGELPDGEGHAAARLRAGEVFSPTVADRQSYEHWAAAGKDELAVATDRVLEILAAAQRARAAARRRASSPSSRRASSPGPPESERA